MAFINGWGRGTWGQLEWGQGSVPVEITGVSATAILTSPGVNAQAVAAVAGITARGCMIYNSSDANKSVATIDFGGDKTSTAGDFTIVFPAAASSTAIIRIA